MSTNLEGFEFVFFIFLLRHVTVGYVDANSWLYPKTTGMMKVGFNGVNYCVYTISECEIISPSYSRRGPFAVGEVPDES